MATSPSSQSHSFKSWFFKTPTFCGSCGKFLWGLGNQGQTCARCNLSIHHGCVNSLAFGCTVGEESQDGRHKFEISQYWRPTFCWHCGSMLWGIYHQGAHCARCKMNVHPWCQDKALLNCMKTK